MYVASLIPDFLKLVLNVLLYLLGKSSPLSAMVLGQWANPIHLFTCHFIGEKRTMHCGKCLRRNGYRVREYWQMLCDLDTYKQSWLDMLDEYNLDAFICPGSALPALPHGMSVRLESSW